MQPQELNSLFRHNLRQRRIELGLTQAELAAKLGVDQAYISDLERGQRNPSLSRLAPLADALDTTPSVLISSAVLAHAS